MAIKRPPVISVRRVPLEEGVVKRRAGIRDVDKMRLLLVLWQNRPFWLSARDLQGMLQTSKPRVGAGLRFLVGLGYVERRSAVAAEKLDRGHFERWPLFLYRMVEPFVPTITPEQEAEFRASR
jgi:hypothetical protein